MPWPQTDIFVPPRPVLGLEIDERRIVRPNISELCPYYHLVPKDPAANRKFRRELIGHATSGKRAQDELWQMCKRDILFYCNAFCYTYNPRKVGTGETPIVQWITYPYQDVAITKILQTVGVSDLCIRKSRDMGATWMILLAFHHRWKFETMQTFLIVSRNADLVDKTGYYDSLFSKLDFLDDPRFMPWFLRPEVDRTDMHVKNLWTDSTIDGQSTTGNVGAGGRRTALLLDEFSMFPKGDDVRALASTQAVTKSRFFNATPKGRGTAYFEVSINPKITHFFLHWSLHPEQSKGLYTTPDGQPHSTYMDNEWERCPIGYIYQQEYEMDDLAADHPFFDQAKIEDLIRESPPGPIAKGHLNFDAGSCKPSGFEIDANGSLSLFRALGPDNKPHPDRTYVLGVDVGTGKGGDQTSNSTISICDRVTREKVAEWANNTTPPEEFADIVLAYALFYSGKEDDGAFIIWEDNGPGSTMGGRIMKTGYRNVYYRKNDKDLRAKQSTTPGWWSSQQSKFTLLAEYRLALARGGFVNPSRNALMECRHYQYKGGAVEYVASGVDMDSGAVGQNHGDRVVADALAWKKLAMSEKAEIPEEAEMDGETPRYTLAWRRQYRKDEERRVKLSRTRY